MKKQSLFLVLTLLFAISCSESIDIKIGEKAEIFEEQWLTCVMKNGEEANWRHTEDGMIGVGRDTDDATAKFVKEDETGYRYFENVSVMENETSKGELAIEMKYHPIYKDLEIIMKITELGVPNPVNRSIPLEGRCYLSQG